MADIVLKDRNGRDVQYPGVNYLKVNTTDGGTQGFAAYDPETLKAENLPVGVTVGDVEGALEVPQLLENVPVALDFTNGDMEITAPDGYALKSGIVQKPANLTPDNIAKDVDIAGVVGTMEAGGGGGNVRFPLLLCKTVSKTYYRYSSSQSSGTFEISMDLPIGSVVQDYVKSLTIKYSSSSTTSADGTATNQTKSASDALTITETETGVTVSVSERCNVYKSYNAINQTLSVFYNCPGFYMTGLSEDGKISAAIDSSETECTNIQGIICNPVSVLDATEATFIPILLRANVETVLISPSIGEVSGTYAFVSPHIKTVNFGLHTSVPTLKSTSVFKNTNVCDVATIEVPAALYDEWIAATNWSSLASYIVPV